MAGVKGRSGGPRPNSGGARPGAGRKKKVVSADSANEPKASVLAPAEDPVDFLKGVWNNLDADPRLRVRAAIGAAQYLRTKSGDGGKKDARLTAAKTVAKSKFAATAPPLKLVRAK